MRVVGILCRTVELKQKEVINVTDGRRMGFVCDVELNLQEGNIDAIIIPGSAKLFGIIGRDNEVVIPWESIKKIGEDIILVDMDNRFMRKFYD
jgi:YlmC/YmxH family sporulation protein